MKMLEWLGVGLVGLSVGGFLRGQEAGPIEGLQQQLRQLQAEFDRQQALQRQQIEALKAQIEALQAAATNAVRTAASSNAAAATAPSWTPAAPITLAGGQRNYLNLSLDGLFAAGGSTAQNLEALQPGGHDPKQRGFTVQNLEAAFEGKVDPYLRAQASLVFQLDSAGESRFEAEEAYLETLAFPANLQLKAGQFLTEFGRLNPTHPHSWTFVDQPLVNARFLGGEGLRNPGARLSWLMPTPFYSELFLAVQNSQGETAFSFRNDNRGTPLFGRPVSQGRFRAFNDLLFAPRYAVSVDLTEAQTLLFGASGAFGPNGSGSDTLTQIYGVDWFWKWKPARHHGGFPFVSWQTEAMLRRYEAGAFADPANPPASLPAETLVDYGFYSEVAYGFRKGWVTALRGDYVSGDRGAFDPDPDRDRRWRLAPNLTWFPSEYSKVRLQYNYDQRKNLGVDHSVWLQFEFLLGAHAAHKF